MDSIKQIAVWVDTEPDVFDGEWFKRFEGMILCGENDLIKTVLTPDQKPYGQEVQ